MVGTRLVWALTILPELTVAEHIDRALRDWQIGGAFGRLCDAGVCADAWVAAVGGAANVPLGGNLNLERNLVDQQIGLLRRKLDALNQPSRIRTIRGSGYQLV